MKAARWLVGSLGRLPTVALAVVLFCALVLGESQLVPVLWLDFLLALVQAGGLVFLLMEAWAHEGRGVAEAVHPRQRTDARRRGSGRVPRSRSAAPSRATLVVRGIAVIVVFF